MKKIINEPGTIVHEMCSGLVLAYPGLEFLPKYKIVKKKEIDPNKVTLISGGGSGHEPAHAGFVGDGMLDAAVCGDVFASPSQVQVYQALKATESDKGTLLIVKNYSGDVMNFKNAAFMAKEDGLEVEMVLVNDDIAVNDSLYTVGRRGVAGTVLVHKIAGAAAKEGLPLSEVKRLAEKAVSNVRSIGFALTSCTVPAKGAPTFDLGESEMEYGIGIHGEPGIHREEIQPADILAERAVDALLEDFGFEPGQEAVVLINGFGGTPLQELFLFNNSVARFLSDKSIRIRKCFVGNFMTSLDMSGASVTIMKFDDELAEYLFADCCAPGFWFDRYRDHGAPEIKEPPVLKKQCEYEGFSYSAEADGEMAVIQGDVLSLGNIIYMVDRMAECVIKNEIPFCELDSFAGDGDFGMSIAKGFRQIRVERDEIIANSETIGDFLDRISLVLMEFCGGASGPIWGAAFRAAGKAAGGKTELTLKEFSEVMQAAVKGIQTVGERAFGRGAVVGDKTLIDALAPCAEKLSGYAEEKTSFKRALEEGAKAAVEGAKSTENIVARMGRAGTVGERSLGYPDAGAHALGVIFTEIANALQTNISLRS